MHTYISLLRGINVGGQRKLPMDTLREIFAQAGFSNVRTYVQSGNAIFDSTETDPRLITTRLEQHIEQVCGYQVKVFIRRSGDFKTILEHNPFLAERNIDTKSLHVSFIYLPVDEATWSKLVLPANIPDRYARGESVIYTYYPNGYARAKISAAYFERALGVPTTDRNWNTVNALYNMAMQV